MVDWENEDEFKGIIEEYYTSEIIDSESGKTLKILPDIEIDHENNEIILSWEVQQKMATITNVGLELIGDVQNLVESFILSASKVCFEIKDIINDKYVSLTVDLGSFEESIRGI